MLIGSCVCYAGVHTLAKSVCALGSSAYVNSSNEVTVVIYNNKPCISGKQTVALFFFSEINWGQLQKIKGVLCEAPIWMSLCETHRGFAHPLYRGAFMDIYIHTYWSFLQQIWVCLVKSIWRGLCEAPRGFAHPLYRGFFIDTCIYTFWSFFRHGAFLCSPLIQIGLSGSLQYPYIEGLLCAHTYTHMHILVFSYR